ncbi:MAG: hypothetical protein U5L07_16680 [Desulfobacterales bacterium]|nr:hypothetical protein [Desulfobacterales bacterium]
MNCPKCNHSLSRTTSPGTGAENAGPIFFCENCGWGKERLEKQTAGQAEAAAAAVDLSAATWIKLLGLWVLSAAFVIAPYVLLVKAPLLFGGADPAVFNPVAASERMAAALNPHYWIVVAVYLLICWTFNPPEFDRHNMGWFGGLVDNPFSFTDDINRTKFKILLLMVPGKIIKMTVVATYRLAMAFTNAA